MQTRILHFEVRGEHDVIAARQRARHVSSLLGFDAPNQTRIATAVSEIVRNAIQYAGGGAVEFAVKDERPKPAFVVYVTDRGQGIANLSEILEGRVVSRTGSGQGIAGSKRIMDLFEVRSNPGRGTSVVLGKFLPQKTPGLSPETLQQIAGELVRNVPADPVTEIHRQNRELLVALAELRGARDELEKTVEQRTGLLVQSNRALRSEIRKRRRTEAAIRRLNLELEQRVADRTREIQAAFLEMEAFSYAVSHDLRVPLRHIEAYAQVLKEDAAASLDDEGRRVLNAIIESARKMTQLTNDLLAFARMAHADMRLTRVNLADVVDDVVKGFQAEVQGRNVEWILGELPEVQGDPPMLRQLLVNLISNALKYTRPKPDARIEIGCRSAGNEITCFVRDNGVGFDMQNATKLFGVFQRFHGDEEFEGTGIGLASVRRIVERHEGRVWAVSAPDNGATFFFALPKKTPTPRAPFRPSAGGSRPTFELP